MSMPVSDSRLPPEIAGRYRPMRVLGKGGMGVVYEVEHLQTGQHFALKVLTTQPGASVERFKREARAASRIESDHVVRITDADFAPELNGAPFLVMELLKGSDLEQTTGDRPAPPADVVAWLRQVARGLAKAHDAGIVHRDLKPENLFLTRREDGSPLVKVLDFGIAKMAVEGTALTASDSFLGTPGYMAPEQTDSSGPAVTLRADLYTLGLIAFKLLTGRSYWKSGSLAQLLAQILAEPMPAASERGSALGPGFDGWFRRACDRDPERRFGSAGEQVEALAAALGLPTEAARASDPGPRALTPAGGAHSSASLNASFTDLTTARRRIARRRLFGGGIAVAVAGIGVALALARGGTPQEPRPSMDSPAAARTALPAMTPPPPPSLGTTPASGADAEAASAEPVAPVITGPGAATKKAPTPAASARTRATVDAATHRGPLDGPW
jgi:eukaryotic-like serine/threonine-protein kinase